MVQADHSVGIGVAGQRARQHTTEQQLDAALESMSDGFALFDHTDTLILHNRRFVEFFPFLERLGELRGRPFEAMVACPGGEWMLSATPEGGIAERMRRHRAADGRPFDIPLTGGGWARVRERRTPEGGIVSTWTDVSELKAAEQHLLEAIAGIGEGFVLLDAEGRVRLCNGRFCAMHLDADRTLAPGQRLSDCLRHDAERGHFAEGVADPAGFVARLLDALDGGSGRRVEIALGDGRWVLASHRRVDNGGLVGIWTDVTAQKNRQAELLAVRAELERQTATLTELTQLLARQARSDPLTGLANRLALEERLERRLAERGGACRTWLLFIDLDQFKSVNDTSGHAAGDEVLREVARYLRAKICPGSLLARLGGDEFAAVLFDVDAAEATAVAARLNTEMRSHPFVTDGRSFTLGLSIGIASFDPDRPSVSALLAAADTACYAAKEAGRGRHQLYSPSGPAVAQAEQTLTWAERIRLALEDGRSRFAPHLQGIFDADGTPVGYEALLRLQDETGALWPPSAFLPAAKRLGLMARIDEWMCRKVIDYAQRLAARGARQYVSMNFGASTLADPLFQEVLLGLLTRHPDVEHTFRIEITETDRLDEPAALTGFLGALRARGIKLYLDDFGSGYNSFNLLKQFHLDGIKIDWSVTRDPLNNVIDLALIKAAVAIADSLGLELVAEGVEHHAQLDTLRALGLTRFQGHLFHAAEEADAVLDPARAATADAVERPAASP